jgi:hypothetical protein
LRMKSSVTSKCSASAHGSRILASRAFCICSGGSSARYAHALARYSFHNTAHNCPAFCPHPLLRSDFGLFCSSPFIRIQRRLFHLLRLKFGRRLSIEYTGNMCIKPIRRFGRQTDFWRLNHKCK